MGCATSHTDDQPFTGLIKHDLVHNLCGLILTFLKKGIYSQLIELQNNQYSSFMANIDRK